MKAKDEIIKNINEMSGRYSPYNIFCDWVELMAISIYNSCFLLHNKVWESREERYKNIINNYKDKEKDTFVKMFGLLCQALEEDMEDVLGDIYMKSGCGNKNTGQFFTPFHLSRLTAKLNIANVNDDEILTINEPSVGGGGMIIATALELKEKGINYQKCMRVTAQDLDWKGVYMSFVQFSMLGINATVVQGDTLCDPYIPNNYPEERIFRTPARMGVLI